MLVQLLLSGITNKTKCKFPQKRIKQKIKETVKNNTYENNNRQQSKSTTNNNKYKQ